MPRIHEPSSIDRPARVPPPSGQGPHSLAGATLGVIVAAATLLLLGALWPAVGRPVEDLTGGLVNGLAAVALAFCALAAASGAVGIGIARLTARSRAR